MGDEDEAVLGETRVDGASDAGKVLSDDTKLGADMDTGCDTHTEKPAPSRTVNEGNGRGSSSWSVAPISGHTIGPGGSGEFGARS